MPTPTPPTFVPNTILRANDLDLAFTKTYNDFLAEFLTADGSTTTPTHDLDMAGYRHTNVAKATQNNQYLSVIQEQNGEAVSGAVSGTPNALTMTPLVPVTAYTVNQKFTFTPISVNAAGGVTLNISGLGPVPVLKNQTAPLAPADFSPGIPQIVFYDGTNFQLVTQRAFSRAPTPIASASTINLTNITGDMVDITGTHSISVVTIADGDQKTLRFQSPLTLVNGATLDVGGTDFSVQAGDVVILRGYDGSVVRKTGYFPSAAITSYVPLSGGTMTGALTMNGAAINESIVDMTSAATVDFNTATGNTIRMAAGGSISTITLAAGSRRVVRFLGTVTLVHSANLVLPGNADITTGAGDFMSFVGDAGGVVYCSDYSKNTTIPTTSFATNGYTILPGGLIMQWGLVGPFPGESGQIVTFPIPFPTAILNASATLYLTGGATTTCDESAQIYSPTTTTMGVYLQLFGGGNYTFPVSAYWQAIGH